jgi:UDP-hydrolysing UDP-N-acetyl-D-glucosamine 2-epimerase
MSAPRVVAVATFARSEYSSCLPLLKRIAADDDMILSLLVSGMHLSSRFGMTVKDIEADGFLIDERIEMNLSDDTPAGLASAVGQAAAGIGAALSRRKPDILLVVGDRFELIGLAGAALPFNIPIAHVSGGDVTEGAADNQVRHAMTKLSHLHFVSMQEHADRILQMGEEPWRVHVTGDPALDSLREMQLLTRTELERDLGMPLTPPVLVATYHPTTLGAMSAAEEIDVFLAGLVRVPATVVMTYPNADAGHRVILDRVKAFAGSRERVCLVPSLGQRRYYSLLALADAIVGNSSSGIWEAPSFRLPAVNVGDRQRGRKRAANVLDAPVDSEAIAVAIRQALTPAFRASLAGVVNPYGDGHAAERIVSVLKKAPLGTALLQKRFMDRTFDKESR